MDVVMFGPLGYFWHLPPTREAMRDFVVGMTLMRMCEFKIKYERHRMQVAQWIRPSECDYAGATSSEMDVHMPSRH
eukprot:8181716-Pyramimonas_sp.AAC.1